MNTDYTYLNHLQDLIAQELQRIEEMKAAGLDTYVAEYQRQFSEFYAQQNQ